MTDSINAKAAKAGRIPLIDEVRGACVLAMVAYHAFFVLGSYFGVAWGAQAYEFFRPAQPAFAAMFILISGICARLSRDVRKRGLLLAAVAGGITLVTVLLLPRLGFEDAQVWFGVLHLLAASMLLFGLGKKLFDKVPAMAGALVCLALFVAAAPVSRGYLGLSGFHVSLPAGLYQNNALAFLGFYNSETFYSWDYFPLLPYVFVFLFGTFLGKASPPAFSRKQRSRFFGFLGRRALPVYLLHMPLFYGAAYLARALFRIGKS
ncbi:MAG: DUF1624 domain-containing protein [Oscillospiraceae bacterium]|nr:DUF1624 domain-containing protein [Oscillospiraceae bacterium]